VFRVANPGELQYNGSGDFGRVRPGKPLRYFAERTVRFATGEKGTLFQAQCQGAGATGFLAGRGKWGGPFGKQIVQSVSMGCGGGVESSQGLSQVLVKS